VGASAVTPCARGTFRGEQGGTSRDACTECPKAYA
jgi:hypothetical protein